MITERQRLEAILLCSAILETARKLETDFVKLKEAAEAFRADCERVFPKHFPVQSAE